MRIAIYGLGYVGCISGTCLADMGHTVIGVDVNDDKVQLVNKGLPTVIEKDFPELIEKMVKKGLFRATTETKATVFETDLAFICVGTPSRTNGSIDLTYIRRVAREIGEGIADIDHRYTVCVRSTVLPGTVLGEVVPILEEASGKVAGRDFGVCMVPEFLREGSSIYDFYNPPKTVIGQYDEESGEPVASLFEGLGAPLVRTAIPVAEMVKYSDNTFHALKVTFANEIGNICKAMGIDSHRVMEIFCLDTKLNLSPYYLKPGFAFGGSCLPKDLRAINYQSRVNDVETQVLFSILESNRGQIARIIGNLLKYKGLKLGFLGLSFKGGTDDLRESPIVEVIEAMIGKGCEVIIYDRLVSVARLVGSNRDYIEQEIPHISSLMSETPDELLAAADVIIVSQASKEFREALDAGLEKRHTVVDLMRIYDNDVPEGITYEGLYW